MKQTYITNEGIKSLVERTIGACQSSLVEKALENGFFSFEDIENLYDSEEQAQEIYEWWIVDSGMAQCLKEQNEPVLENEYGIWWGRTTTGQAIYLDYVIQEIYRSLQI